MVQRDPISDFFQLDAERITRAFNLAGGQIPIPGIGAPVPSQEPRTPTELIANLPNQINQTVQTGLNLLANAPQLVVGDLTLAVNYLLQAPAGWAQEGFYTPRGLAERLAPENLGKVFETVRDSAEFRNASPQDMRARMRTITDVIDLFTPT